MKTIMCERYRGDTAKEAEALKFRLIDKQRNGIMLSSERDVDMGHSHPYGKVRFWHTNRLLQMPVIWMDTRETTLALPVW